MRSATSMIPISLPRIALVSAAVTLIWTLCCLGVARRVGFPEPSVHDEFGYLLGADTFVRGRLANPPHPLNRFFASPSILQQPTYTSMSPPGQSLVLALGEKLFGRPYCPVLGSRHDLPAHDDVGRVDLTPARNRGFGRDRPRIPAADVPG
jgi:hypothetical protein